MVAVARVAMCYVVMVDANRNNLGPEEIIKNIVIFLQPPTVKNPLLHCDLWTL